MKFHFASFLSFLQTKSFPTKEDVLTILDAPFSFFKAILGITLVACVSLFLALLLRISGLVSVEVPDYGGSMTEAVIGAPRYINPLLAKSETDQLLTSLVYAPLAKVADDGSLAPVLAKECVPSPDSKSYQCILPQTLTFSDKTPLTSADVAYTYETKKAFSLQSDPESDWAALTVEAPDAHTVVLKTNATAASLKEKLSLGIVPQKLWGAVPADSIEDSVLNMAPVGAGAFVVHRIKVVGTIPTEVLLRPNPRYVGQKPYLHELVVRSFANQLDLKTALRSAPTISTSALKGAFIDPSIQSTLSIKFLPMHKSVALFVQQEQQSSPAATRLQYASYFLDRKKIVDTIENGYGIPLYPLGSSPRSPTLSPLSISIAVQKDDEMIATANLLSTELEEFGILSTVTVFDQGLFTDQLHLGHYSFVLAATADTIPGYQRLIPLYMKTIVHIASPAIHASTPTIVDSIHESLRDAPLWYVRTDTVWKWFKQ